MTPHCTSYKPECHIFYLSVFSLNMTTWKLLFWTKCFKVFGSRFGCSHVFLLVGAFFVGSWTEFGSLAETALRRSDQNTFGRESHVLYSTNMTTNEIPIRSSDPAPLYILGPSHISALKDLLSDKKITVRLGLRITVPGPSELLEPQLHLLLNKQPGLFNLGNKAGLFFMRVLEIKKVSRTS